MRRGCRGCRAPLPAGREALPLTARAGIWDQMRAEALREIGQAAAPAEIEALRVRLLGRRGTLTLALRAIGDLPPEDRPAAGQAANAAREAIASALEARLQAVASALAERSLAGEAVDVTLPGTRPPAGHPHPLATVRLELEAIFSRLGFAVAEGPEIETDWHNFEALNMPAGHPARDAHDSFYLAAPPEAGRRWLLRTHTSPVQIRHMLSLAGGLPVRIVCPGRVYRRDAASAGHSPMFHQIEGLLVDHGVHLGHLKGVLATATAALFGPGTRTRFRPSYFPFTEPSVEVDVSCRMCGGQGCAACKGSGWMEILGAGMVHPAVLRAGGYDPEEVSAFAFGMGIDRCTMLRYGISDMRLLFDGDLRFLEQF